jgi:hypothetical protein
MLTTLVVVVIVVVVVVVVAAVAEAAAAAVVIVTIVMVCLTQGSVIVGGRDFSLLLKCADRPRGPHPTPQPLVVPWVLSPSLSSTEVKNV